MFVFSSSFLLSFSGRGSFICSDGRRHGNGAGRTATAVVIVSDAESGCERCGLWRCGDDDDLGFAVMIGGVVEWTEHGLEIETCSSGGIR